MLLLGLNLTELNLVGLMKAPSSASSMLDILLPGIKKQEVAHAMIGDNLYPLIYVKVL